MVESAKRENKKEEKNTDIVKCWSLSDLTCWTLNQQDERGEKNPGQAKRKDEKKREARQGEARRGEAKRIKAAQVKKDRGVHLTARLGPSS